jgi:Outer membrane lipoprotein-sorting protein
MKSVTLFLACAALLCSNPRMPARDQEAPAEPTAEQIVQRVHLSRALKKGDLRGTLSKDDLEVPFIIRLEADLMRFYFDDPRQIINLNLKPKGAELSEITANSNQPVAAARYAEGIRHTDLTYDDISLRYLYWPNPIKQPNIETVSMQKCWVVDLANNRTSGEYKTVRIFVAKASGSLMKVMAFDRNDKLVKVMTVTAGMKVDGATVLKTMNVIRYSHISGTKKVAGETSFELEKP